MRNNTVLILTNSEDATSDYLETYLREANYHVMRFNTDLDLESTDLTFSKECQAISWCSGALQPHEISSVVFRRPKPFNPSLDNNQFYSAHAADEWTEAWEGFLAQIPLTKWINHPSRNFSASHKIDQLIRASNIGFRVPETFVTNNPKKALEFIRLQKNGVIIKPLASGFIERDDPKDDTVIYTVQFDESNIPLLQFINTCPVLFQEKINKIIDIRVTVLDESICAIGLKGLGQDGRQRIDIRRNNMIGVEYIPLEVPDQIRKAIVGLMKQYELRFAAIDFAIDDREKWVFFEINPNGQWAWLDLEGVSSIAGMFGNTLNAQ
jgi:glutathione synthase/RimK-type ligase-like ATP-grasp enzyme